MGVIYDNKQNYEKALEYYLKSQEMAESTKNKTLMANNLNNIGGVYLYQNDYKRALEYFLKALAIKEELGNKNGIANSLINIGTLYYSLEDFPKTMKYFLYALKIKEEIKDKAGIATVCGNIGALYIQMGRFDRAESYLLRSLAISEEIKSFDDMSNAHLNLSDLYDSTKKLSQSLFHYKKYKACQDSIFNEEKSKDMGRLEARSDFDKQQAVSNAEHKKELELSDEREKRQTLVSYSVGAGLLLVLLFAGFLFNRFRVIRKQKAIIEHQKKIVEEKQKETMDSIYYAKRIQGSLLTSELYFERELNRLNKN